MENNIESEKKVNSINIRNSLLLNGRAKDGNKKVPESNLQFQLKELKEINARLENRLVQDTDILNEVVARNAKFMSIVAHDLRNPFNSIIGILDILAENIDNYRKDEIEGLIHIASGSAINAYKLLENLLDWSAAQNIEKSFNPVKINLRELILSEIESFIQQLEHRMNMVQGWAFYSARNLLKCMEEKYGQRAFQENGAISNLLYPITSNTQSQLC